MPLVRLTHAQISALLSMADYVLDVPCLEYVETLTKRQQATHERAVQALIDAQQERPTERLDDYTTSLEDTIRRTR